MPTIRTRPETLPTGLLLAGAGGFLDAYTFIGRGGVFANAQTGNIVLLASSYRANDARQQRELPAQRLVHDDHLCGLRFAARRPRIDAQVAVSLADALLCH
jgi:uncharacterized protein DUF1275